MDWGLLDKNAGENLLLREQIVYDYKVGDSNMYLEQHSHVGLQNTIAMSRKIHGYSAVNWWKVSLPYTIYENGFAIFIKNVHSFFIRAIL